MPGPTGMQPSKLKSPVPEMSAPTPQGESIEFKTPLEIGGREPASEDLGALLDDYGIEGDITGMVPSPGSVSFPSQFGKPGSIVEDTPVSVDEIFADDTLAVEDGSGAMPVFEDGTPNFWYGKEAESTIGGIKTRVSKDGIPEVYDTGLKKYRPPTEGEKAYFGQLRSGKLKLLGDASAVGAGIGAALIPGGLLTRIAIEGGAGALGSIGGDLISREALINGKEDYMLRRLSGINDSEAFAELSASNIGTRAAISGGIGALGGAVAGGAAVFASKKAAQAKALNQLKPSLKQAQEIQEMAKSLGIQLSPSEAATGIPQLQFADQLGVDEIKSIATPAQLALMEGTSSPGDAIAFYNWNQARLDKAMNVWDEVSASLGGRFSGKAPSELPITKMGSYDKATKGISPSVSGAQDNIFDRIKQKHLEEVSNLRTEIRNLAPERQLVDPIPVIAEVESSIRPLLPKGSFDLGGGKVGRYVEADGSVNWDMVLSNKDIASGDSDAYKAVLNSVRRIRNKVSRLPGGLDRLKQMRRRNIFDQGESSIQKNIYQGVAGPDGLPNMKGNLSLDRQSPINATKNTSLFSPQGFEGAGQVASDVQMTLPGKSYQPSPPQLALLNENPIGSREGMLTFDEVVALTDSLQDLAYSKKMEGTFAGVLKSMADASRKLEGQAASQIAKSANRKSLAVAYEDANMRASKAINSAQTLKQMINENPEAMGPALYGNSSRLKTALDVMNDSEVQQLRSLVINSANFGNITKSGSRSTPVGLNAQKIKEQLFGSPSQIESANALFGEGDASRLKSILDIIDRIPPPSAPTGSRLGPMQAAVNAYKGMKYGHGYVPDLFEKALSRDPDIADIVMPQVRDISVALEKAAEKASKQAAFLKKVSKGARFTAPALQSVPTIYNQTRSRKP